jgi:hypothetical protein
VDLMAVGEAPVMDPTVVEKAVGEATAVHAWRRSRSGRVSGEEMIVAKVRF